MSLVTSPQIVIVRRSGSEEFLILSSLSETVTSAFIAGFKSQHGGRGRLVSSRSDLLSCGKLPPANNDLCRAKSTLARFG